jgi:hypothetical protein
MPPEPGIIRDDGFVLADLRNMDASRRSVSRDDGIVIAGSGDMDAPLTGVLWMIPFLVMDRF